MNCQADRCKYLDFIACSRPATLEVCGRWSTFLLCRDCKDRLIASRRSDGNGWTIKRLAGPPVLPMPIVFLAACAVGVAIAVTGCGSVEPADVVTGAAGAAGAAGNVAELGGRSGSPGDGGQGGIAPMPGNGAGGAAGAGQASGGNGGAPATGGAGAPGADVDAGAAWPACPHVVSFAIAQGAHCFQGCRSAAGAIAEACELTASDAAGWKPYQAPLYCVPAGGPLPDVCR